MCEYISRFFVQNFVAIGKELKELCLIYMYFANMVKLCVTVIQKCDI